MPDHLTPAELPGLAVWIQSTPEGLRNMLTGEILARPGEPVSHIACDDVLADAPHIVVTPPA